MKLDSIAWRSISLVPDRLRDRSHEPLVDVLAIGETASFDALELARIAGDELDPKIIVLARNNAFSLLRIPVSIRRREGVDIRLVQIEVEVYGSAVSWSMDPLRVEQETKVRTQVKVSAGLEVKPVSVGSSEEAAEEYLLRQPEIEAYWLGRPVSGWEFRPVQGKDLSGVHILSIIFKAQQGQRCKGVVRIAAELYQKSWLIPYRARDVKESVDVLTFDL